MSLRFMSSFPHFPALLLEVLSLLGFLMCYQTISSGKLKVRNTDCSNFLPCSRFPAALCITSPLDGKGFAIGKHGQRSEQIFLTSGQIYVPYSLIPSLKLLCTELFLLYDLLQSYPVCA